MNNLILESVGNIIGFIVGTILVLVVIKFGKGEQKTILWVVLVIYLLLWILFNFFKDKL